MFARPLWLLGATSTGTSANAAESLTWKLIRASPSCRTSRIESRPLVTTGPYTYTYTGKGVNAQILDTGLQFNHTDFGGRAALVQSFIAGETTPDGFGHGTFVAGVIGSTTYGVAKGVTLKGVKVLNGAGSGPF